MSESMSGTTKKDRLVEAGGVLNQSDEGVDGNVMDKVKGSGKKTENQSGGKK